MNPNDIASQTLGWVCSNQSLVLPLLVWGFGLAPVASVLAGSKKVQAMVPAPVLWIMHAFGWNWTSIWNKIFLGLDKVAEQQAAARGQTKVVQTPGMPPAPPLAIPPSPPGTTADDLNAGELEKDSQQ